MTNPESFLPPGFRFHPTDEELILHYLRNKAAATPCPASIIAEVDIYKFDPWDLPAKAAFGEKEWYFFSPRDRKYPNGARPNRAAVSGYWKATGTDRPILASQGGNGNIGVKKALVFYKGRPPKGIKTNWIMHEFRLPESPSSKPNYKYKDLSMRLDDWVLCRIYKKSNGQLSNVITMKDHQELEEHFIQDSTFPLPLETSSNYFPNQNSLKLQKSLSFSDLFDAMDYSTLTRIMSDNPLDPIGFEYAPILDNCSIDHQNILNKCSLNNNSSYLIQRPPQGDSFMEKQLKRERSASEEVSLHPSKKLNPSCSTFTNNNNTTSSQFDASQYHLLNQPFFNQQLLLSSHLQL